MAGVPISVLTTLTFVCSILSLFGSVIVISSYRIARTKSKPKAAQLIHNLALTDFFWFLASLTMSSFWLTDPESVEKSVPTFVCYLVTPTISFTRLGSLVWTCAVSFDVYMSVNRRHWDWRDEEDRWNSYRRRYIGAVLILALPATLINLVTQHLSKDNHNLGCSPGYEELGNWVIVTLTEVLPITLGFICNVTVYFLVRRRMSMKAYPQSVRKKRRRIMYYYMIACIWSWTPTILFYLIMILGVPPKSFYVEAFEVFCRGSLYLTGFVNFLIFGMSDPHLSRSFSLVLYYLGLHACMDPEYTVGGTTIAPSPSNILKTKDVEKTVMFGGAISKTADRSSTKRDSLRYKLSPEEKLQLYQQRPDLDTRSDMREPLMKKKRKKKSSDGSRQVSTSSDGYSESSSVSSEGKTDESIVLLQDRLLQIPVPAPSEEGSNEVTNILHSDPPIDVESGVLSSDNTDNVGGPLNISAVGYELESDDNSSVSSEGSQSSFQSQDDESSSDEDDDEDKELKSPIKREQSLSQAQ